jgi:hypothetical protein
LATTSLAVVAFRADRIDAVDLRRRRLLSPPDGEEGEVVEDVLCGLPGGTGFSACRLAVSRKRIVALLKKTDPLSGRIS